MRRIGYGGRCIIFSKVSAINLVNANEQKYELQVMQTANVIKNSREERQQLQQKFSVQVMKVLLLEQQVYIHAYIW
jgi:hypothetical protein